jgi:hypothetical protein
MAVPLQHDTKIRTVSKLLQFLGIMKNGLALRQALRFWHLPVDSVMLNFETVV